MFLLPTETSLSIRASIHAFLCCYMFVCVNTYTRVSRWFPLSSVTVHAAAEQYVLYIQ